MSLLRSVRLAFRRISSTKVGGCVGSHLVDPKNLPICADWPKGTRKIGQDSVPNLSSFANTLKVDTTNVNKFLYNRRRSSLRLINRRRVSASRRMVKLYSVSDSPPTLAVRMALKYLDINCELVDMDFGNAEQIKPEFLEKNPQGEVPLLDDDGFVLSESVAIIQYLADKYKKDDTFYPEDPKERAIVNHRLAFHLSTLYKAVVDYMILPLCYAYPRTDMNLKKLLHAIKVFEEILTRQDKAYVAGDNLTIADLPMVMAMVCLEAMTFEFGDYPKVQSWYQNFKDKHADLWELANAGLQELTAFEQNPPDLSHVDHPIHPTDRKQMKESE